MIPRWAEHISVEVQGESLIVIGEGRIFTPVSRARITPADMEEDLLRQYVACAKVGEKRFGKNPPHIQFANTGDDAGLVDFVRHFGPLSASPVYFHEELATITANQSLVGLRRDQTIFAGAMKLVSELAEKKAPDPSNIADGLVQIANGASMPGPRTEVRTVPQFSERPWYGFAMLGLTQNIAQRENCSGSSLADLFANVKPSAIRHYGLLTLSVLMNSFQPVSFPTENSVLELPVHDPHGILPVLYYMLRQDVLRQHGIMMCAQRDCGSFFRIERTGQRFCSERCSRLERQRKYWDEKGRARRKLRMRKRKQTKKGGK